MTLMLVFLSTVCSFVIGHLTYEWISYVLVLLWLIMIWPSYRDVLVFALVMFAWSGSALVLVLALWAGNRWAIGLDEENAR